MGYEKGLVVFIDVLGTRNTIDFDRKLLIHNLWHNSASETEQRGNNFKDIRSLNRKVFSFSDCAYYTYIFKANASSERKISIAPFYEVLGSLTSVIQRIMREGFFVRGGAVLGDIFVDDRGIFGPAAEQAYEIESKCAKYPRIVLDNEFGQKLFDYEREVSYPDSQPLIYKDENLYFINIFYGFTADWNCGLVWEDFTSTLQAAVGNTLNSINSQRIEEPTKDKIREKMEWIQTKIEEECNRMPRYKEIFNNCMEKQLLAFLGQ